MDTGSDPTRPRSILRPMLRLRHAARLGGEFVAYAVVNRVWWILPLVAVLAIVALAVTVTQAAAPYTLYTLF